MQSAATAESDAAALSPLARWAFPVLAMLGATAVVFRLVWPVHTGPVGFDSAASVIHFDRIVSGQRLESFITTTPKPLLTFLYGITHAVVSDWRAISILAIAAFGLAVLLAAVQLTRLAPDAPRWVASLVAALALVGSPLLIEDVGIAYAVVWALLGWLVACLGATSRPVRPWLVGLGILVATLARLETVVVTGTLALVLAWSAARTWTGHRPAVWTPRRVATALGVAALALPVMLVHDWLLTGDPFFWAHVSASFSAATSSIPKAGDVARAVVAVFSERPLLSLAALGGLAHLVRARRPEPVIGLLALGPGLGALLVLLAARGTYVSSRYYAGIEIAVVLAAAIGLAAAAGILARLVERRVSESVRRRALISGLVAGAAVAAVIVASPFAPRDRAARSYLSTQRAYAQAGDEATPIVAGLLGDGRPVAGTPAPTGSRAQVIVPALLRPRMAVDLNLALWAIGGLGPSVVAADGSGVHPGLVIVHAARFDKPLGGYGVLETGGEVALGDHTLVTAATLPNNVWVLQVR